jgi:crotonobetainyl-CoA:carnitine CoA-transferase CaiB-like acyl-CoA transferase
MVFGPYCTQIMADMGADVIKIEPPGGDNTRFVSAGPAPGMGGVFVNINRGKRSVMLDLRQAKDKAALEALISTADVFIPRLSIPIAMVIRGAGLMATDRPMMIPSRLNAAFPICRS